MNKKNIWTAVKWIAAIVVVLFIMSRIDAAPANNSAFLMIGLLTGYVLGEQRFFSKNKNDNDY